jgi:hypothetical protein
MKRMGSALKCLMHYAQEGDEYLESVVTGNKTWGFHHTPESKHQSLQWCLRIPPDIRIWQDFGSALPFQTRLTHTKLSNEHGSQVKEQGRWQCCYNKHKKFPYRPTRDVSSLSWYALYVLIMYCMEMYIKT